VNLFENLVQDTGNVNAHYALGVAYSKGTGVEVNSTKAIDHLNVAANHGIPGAFNTLGFIHNRGIGETPANQTKARNFVNKAAELGSVEAIANLGVLYLNGEGVEKDIDKATRYLRLASLGGHTVSAFYLGVLIYNGIGTYYDCDEAVEMFTEVYHESDIARFMHNANSFFESGDFVGAYLNYAIAASLGFSNAGLNLAYMFEKNLLDDICLKSSTFC